MAEAIILRADASEQIGSGHVMRCLALAQAWQDRGKQSIFVMATDAPALVSRLQSGGFEVLRLRARPGNEKDAAETANLAQEREALWVVIDGYHFTPDYQRAIKNAGLDLLVIDDNGEAGRYHSDIILNQNIHAAEALYEKRDSGTRLLLGPKYALLRREFLKWRGWKREFPEVARKILVTMGGSDSNNVTLKVIRALQHLEISNLEATIVIGEHNPFYEELKSATGDLGARLSLTKNATDMSELMAWADVAIASGGSTNWELAFLGLPTCILAVADNQVQIAKTLNQQGIAIYLGWFSKVTEAELIKVFDNLIKSKLSRKEMSNRARKLIDGRGPRRVAAMLLENKRAPTEVQSSPGRD